ncbi:MAG: DNA methyltransferase [Candidatus Paceibacterota bacterium]|jgi:site-specific DNA-methyltransferase (adenine-specific)
MKKSAATKPKSSIKVDDIFQLGSHFLACGDARDKELVKKLIGKEKIKAVITDVPYGVAVAESKQNFKTLLKNKVIVNDHIQSDAEYRRFTHDWIEAVKPYLERKNSFYIFNSDKMIFALREGMAEAGITFSQLLIWVKNHSVIGRKDYLPMHELIAFGWYGTHDFKKSKDKSVLCFPKPNKSSLHPTMKPVGLVRHLILNSTDIGDLVYSGFGGSGTDLIACEQTKRRCFMVELDSEYCQTIIDRFEKLTGFKSKKI